MQQGNAIYKIGENNIDWVNHSSRNNENLFTQSHPYVIQDGNSCKRSLVSMHNVTITFYWQKIQIPLFSLRQKIHLFF